MSEKQQRQIDGILLFDKPIGISSNQALQQVKKLFRAKKAGHTGSLDVLASGLLPICFGKATKSSQLLLNANKYYRVTAKLGEQTVTGDAEGEIIGKKPIKHVTVELLNQVLDQFRGEVQQIPSMYSALKYRGKPLYKWARMGVEVERKARIVHIYQLVLLDWCDDRLQLEVSCSKGTYIRNLIEDIGYALGCGAYVTELRRLGAGVYTASQMMTLQQLRELYDVGGLKALDEKLLQWEISESGSPH